MPDLRVDFFTEPMDSNMQKRHSYVEITMKQIVSPSDISPSMSSTNINIVNSTGINVNNVNVTSNPMDDTATTVACTTQTPRATIVVQQVKYYKQNMLSLPSLLINFPTTKKKKPKARINEQHSLNTCSFRINEDIF